MNWVENLWEIWWDSIVQKYSDKVFEITDLNSKYVKTHWKKIEKISVKTLKNNSTLLTYYDINTKEKWYVSEVQYIEWESLVPYMSLDSIFELYEKITFKLEQIIQMNLRQSGISYPATQIDISNIKVTWFSDWVLKITITDICCDIYGFSLENNPNFCNSRVVI